MAMQSLYTLPFTTCANNTDLTVSSFNASITPSNRTLTYYFTGQSTFSGNETFDLSLIINGTAVFGDIIDPSRSVAFANECPASPGPVEIGTSVELPEDTLKAFPASVLSSTDLNAQMRLRFRDVGSGGVRNIGNGTVFGCVEANLTNGLQQQAPAGNATTTAGPTSTGNSSAANSTNSGVPHSGASVVSVKWRTSMFLAISFMLYAACL